MLASITHLLQAKDLYGAFVMCLNAVEPLAKRRYPTLGNGERFQRFLYEERQEFWGGKVFLPDAKKCGKSPRKDSPDLEDFDGDIERWKEASTLTLKRFRRI